MLPPDLIEEMKSETEDHMVNYQLELGMWMGSNWGLLWSKSKLTKYFNTLGIYHPFDMFSIILNSFWRHLNNQPIELENQVQYYKDYWEKQKNKKENP